MKHDTYKKDKSKLIIVSLVVVVLVLLAIVVWSLIAKPAIRGYMDEKQIEAQGEVVQSILFQIKQQGYIQITDADNTVVTLVEYTQPAESA